MVDADAQLGIYEENILSLDDPDDLCLEVMFVLVDRDGLSQLTLSTDQQTRLAELDDQLVSRWEILAECLPYPTPRERQNWWWFLHEGPQVRGQVANKPKTTVQQMLDDGKSRSEIIQELDKLGFTESHFMLAMELGEIDGDVVTLDAQGRPIKPSPLFK